MKFGSRTYLISVSKGHFLEEREKPGINKHGGMLAPL